MRLRYIFYILFPLLGASIIFAGISSILEHRENPLLVLLYGAIVGLGLVLGTILWWGKIINWIERNW